MARRRADPVPTVAPSAVIGVPGTIVAPPPTPIARTLTGDVLATHHRPTRPGTVVGHAVLRGSVIGLDPPPSTAELDAAHVTDALDAAGRQRKRAAGGAASSTPLLGTAGAARPVLTVRGLLGS